MADPFSIAGIGANLLGGIFGNSAASKERRAAEQARARALAEYAGIQLPTVADQQLALQQYQLTGELTPEMEQAINLGPSAYEDIQTDPRLAQAQMQALSTLQELGTSGLTSADKADLEQIRRQTANEETARRQQILQNMAARGVGGSGVELAAQLSSSQAAANRASQEAGDLAKLAMQRKLEALTQSGNLGGQIRQQQFGEQEAIARARDVQNQFNTQNAIARQQRNIGAQNQAQQTNLAARQNISEKNTGLSNEQQQYNKNLLQQQFQNQMQLAGAKSGALLGQAQAYQQAAADTANRYAGIGSALGQGLSAYGQYQAQQPINQATTDLIKAQTDYYNRKK